ncbi:MAG: PilW family protein [Myxococcota bacterium]|nr:prepilin-type N-terminal cleavage/methylation domain-containing protein [Myxococcota bacterium]
MRRGERGFTLLEVMVVVGLLMYVIGGAMLFMISQARSQRTTYERSDMQRSGRSAIALLARDLPKTGLGLPTDLAIRSYERPGTSADSCGTTPELTLVGLDYTREWTIGAATNSSIRFAPITPVGAADAIIKNNSWLFVFQNAGIGGYGMAQVGADRAAGSADVAIASTNYSSVQPSLSLVASAFNGGAAGGHAPVALAADVMTIGVNCADAAHPFLYMRRAGGERLLLAADVDTRALTAADPAVGAVSGDVVALRFRFLVDDNGDGFPDDVNSDNQIDVSDLVVTPTSLANVVGIEVFFRLRKLDTRTATTTFETNDFAHTIMLPNVHTATASRTFVFIDNIGMKPR